MKNSTITLSAEAEEDLRHSTARAGYKTVEECVEDLFGQILSKVRKAKEQGLDIVLKTRDGKEVDKIIPPKSAPVKPQHHPINIPSGRHLQRSIEKCLD